MSANAFLYSSL